MFTGLDHTQIKKISSFNSLGYKIPTVSEILKENGFETYCYTENSYISKIFQLTKGFDKIVNNFKKGFIWLKRNIKLKFLLRPIKSVERVIKRFIPFKKGKTIWKGIKEKVEAFIFKLSLRFFWKYNLFNFENKSVHEIKKFMNSIEKPSAEDSYYIFFNLMAPHEPYNPPKEIMDKFNFTNKDLRTYKELAFNAHEFKVYMNQISKRFQKKYPAVINGLYNASVYYTDYILKCIFSLLRNKDLIKNSYIIITSDHGELLGGENDHFLWGHAMPLKSVHRSLTHVPLLIYHNNFQRKIIKKQVQLKDLFNTILDLAQISDDKYNLYEPRDSIIQQIKNNSTPKYVFGEFLKNDKYINDILLINSHKLGNLVKKHLDFKMKNHIWFIRSNTHKYINYGNKIEEFFNIGEDPYEQHNIFDENDTLCQKFRIYLQDYLKKIKNVKKIKNLITKSEKNKIGEAVSSRLKNFEFKI
jgi:arylsulfatase A-like enzyme